MPVITTDAGFAVGDPGGGAGDGYWADVGMVPKSAHSDAAATTAPQRLALANRALRKAASFGVTGSLWLYGCARRRDSPRAVAVLGRRVPTAFRPKHLLRQAGGFEPLTATSSRRPAITPEIPGVFPLLGALLGEGGPKAMAAEEPSPLDHVGHPAGLRDLPRPLLSLGEGLELFTSEGPRLPARRDPNPI